MLKKLALATISMALLATIQPASAQDSFVLERIKPISPAILLDPVYSGKGMAGLIGLIRQGYFSKEDNVVFLHTGGSAALFAYPSLTTQEAA